MQYFDMLWRLYQFPAFCCIEKIIPARLDVLFIIYPTLLHIVTRHRKKKNLFIIIIIIIITIIEAMQ